MSSGTDENDLASALLLRTGCRIPHPQDPPKFVFGNHVLKLSYLTEFAAMLAAHAPQIIERPDGLSNAMLSDYYIHARNRFNRWIRDLNDLDKGVAIRDPLHLIGLNPARSPAQSIAEQILINDLLNRVWTVTMVACDRFRGEHRCQALVDNVFQGHLSVRHKALGVCLKDQSLDAGMMKDIDQLRATTERWTDLLCCDMMGDYNLWNYGFDPDRSKEFYRDRREKRSPESRAPMWTLLLAGLRHSFPDDRNLGAPLHEDDRLIVRLMLSAFPETEGTMAIWSGPTVQRSR